jgi:ferredoxin
MPKIVIHAGGQTHVGDVPANTNLVVQAGSRRFPFPHLRYGCGMGKCARCACRVLEGAQHLPEPGWKERRQLGPRLDEGYRLMCQIWVQADIALAQDDEALAPEVGAATREQPCS